MYRAGSGLGLFRSIVVFGLFIFLLVALYSYLSIPAWSELITGVYLATILTLQIKRPDKRFLKINIENHRTVLFFEYLVLSIPLLLCQLYLQLFELASISMVVLFLIPFIDFSFQRKGLNNLLIKAIPDEAFEWKAGIRKYFFLVVIVWPIGLLGSYYLGSIPVAIIILGLVFVNFYEKGEPLSILMSPELNPQRFLLRKLIISQTIISFVLLPLVLVFILLHSDVWYIPVIEFVLISFILWYAIFLKYAFYKPNIPLMAGQLFMALGAMSLFLPFLIPLTWVLSIRFYFKSVANLKPYLDDFD